jgi:hypothetical protein
MSGGSVRFGAVFFGQNTQGRGKNKSTEVRFCLYTNMDTRKRKGKENTAVTAQRDCLYEEEPIKRC